MVGRNGDPNTVTEAVWVHLAVVVRKTSCKNEKSCSVFASCGTCRDETCFVLEQRVVQREGVAKLIRQRKFVEEAVAVTIRCKNK